MQGTFAQQHKDSKKIMLSGFVKDINGQPIKDVIIVTPNSSHTKKTNKKGFYKIKVQPSADRILALSSANGYLEKKISGKNNLNFILQINDDHESAEYQAQRSNDLIALGYHEDVVYENSPDAVIFNGRKVNPHKYPSIEEMLDAEMISNEYVVSKNGLYIVDGDEFWGVWNLKDIKPSQVKSIEIESIYLATRYYGYYGFFGVCKVKTRNSDTD